MVWLLDCNKQIINQSFVSAAGLGWAGLGWDWLGWAGLVTGAVLHSGSHFVCSRHINVNWSQAENTNLQYSIFHHNTRLLNTGGSAVLLAKKIFY